MIRHIVLLDLPRSYDAAELAQVMSGLAALKDEITGFDAFSHGPNHDFEQMSPECAYAFTCDFADQVTAMAYLDNPTHKALGGRLVALCREGARGITVIDMEMQA